MLVLGTPREDGAPVQLWRLSYPDGKLTRLTNDLNDYLGVSVAAGGDLLVTGQRQTRARLWVGDADGRSGTEAVGRFLLNDPLPKIAWSGDRIVYPSTASGRSSIMSVVPGGVPQEVVAGGLAPAATRDGRTIVFWAIGADGSREIWRADADGRNRRKLASGTVPLVTPDSHWVVFYSDQSGVQTPWIVPIEGGTSRPLVKYFVGVGGVDVTRDGKSFLMPAPPDRFGTMRCDIPDCANQKISDQLRGGTFTPAGEVARSLRDGPGQPMNIWTAPLNGGPIRRQLTHFTDVDEMIVDFAWSPDGKRLAVLRRTITSDIVLFTGLKKK
jgi:Tol biopolymer transport system component